ncbi:tRNA lysidine(34) synthetase TilS [Clostridium butyricum]|uniref:tRNA lysidine(34) synthetase TilS n=1 Tax=Clostridium butyricum TaxID=1492 RepID=UPI0013D30E53|nr:tRNA lysidine(34) synthetase TilS [Clostridium butyricum]MCQ2015867.1 tRNA lysidine(34) synthetase TilS [Clostridium butyricum]MCQ2023360.1 tRNA lysidine(34) synthetase TilS [Clostridium butyricum]NFB73210.1 tRNA lysidine(34) synthetase TilS [Clostridium butyricum]NFB92505.1 tRNA lysidine(34) synthetase TilS [Clostridium butyricum]UTY51701.1 tRNA lysidine(34) synthetase TilS [Clostridium butyricum]
MYKKVMSYIKDNNLIKSGDKVLVALSGGPDSVCLLNILYNLKAELNIEIGAAHLNHLLRDKDAFEDEEYVKTLCKSLDIPCFVKRVDINKYSKDKKMSSEMAGRDARYNFFDDIVKDEGYTKIATAHNANDQAETILFRLMRGSGIEGLCGIKVRRDKIIRPILCLSRKEVEEYIEINNLKPRIDKTNFEKIYNRNKIRLDMIPYIKENFNEDIIQTLNRMSVLLQKDNEFIENSARSFYEKHCIEQSDYFIIKKEMFDNKEAVVTRVIRYALTNFSKTHYDFEMKHIYEICNLAKNNSGKAIDLPNKIYAENIYGDIYIKERININNIDVKQEIVVNKNEINGKKIFFNDENIKFSVLKNDSNLDLNQNNFIKYFDFDKINDSISLRKRKNGDKIIPLGMKGSKKIKDLFIDMKVPKEERDCIPLLCFDENISWIVGIRVSEEYKITNKTKNILRVIVERKEK